MYVWMDGWMYGCMDAWHLFDFMVVIIPFLAISSSYLMFPIWGHQSCHSMSLTSIRSLATAHVDDDKWYDGI